VDPGCGRVRRVETEVFLLNQLHRVGADNGNIELVLSKVIERALEQDVILPLYRLVDCHERSYCINV
jgi:hypothetical protein